MRKIIIFLLSIVWCLLFATSNALAHLPGQAPFFTINGTYSGLYPVASTSLYDFPLPQDLAPKNYKVDESISFEIVESQLPAPVDIINRTNFYWDYGDGESGTGFKNIHVYKKPGSYLLTIKTDFGQGNIPASQLQLFQSVLLHVLPNDSYQLPKATVSLNGVILPSGPGSSYQKIDMQKEIVFDASESIAPSSKIKEYFWDFGDGSSSSAKLAKHSYNVNFTIAFPLLRVTDENGFVNDTFIALEHKKDAVISGQKKEVVTTQKSSNTLWIIVGITAIVGFVSYTFFIKKRK